ncbi:hypothetical protein H4Q26_015983, partial [Puccinia striiformis f. sp. tritici PST-130]
TCVKFVLRECLTLNCFDSVVLIRLFVQINLHQKFAWTLSYCYELENRLQRLITDHKEPTKSLKQLSVDLWSLCFVAGPSTSSLVPLHRRWSFHIIADVSSSLLVPPVCRWSL